MYKGDLELNNLQWFIYHETQPINPHSGHMSLSFNKLRLTSYKDRRMTYLVTIEITTIFYDRLILKAWQIISGYFIPGS